MSLDQKIKQIQDRLGQGKVTRVPRVIRNLLPKLKRVAPEHLARVLLKEFDRQQLLAAFDGSVLPGVFSLPFTREQIERATQAMLNAAYPGREMRTDLDVATGDIEEVARRMADELDWEYERECVRHGVPSERGAAAVRRPRSLNLLDQAARSRRCFFFGMGWECAAPWIDMEEQYE